MCPLGPSSLTRFSRTRNPTRCPFNMSHAPTKTMANFFPNERNEWEAGSGGVAGADLPAFEAARAAWGDQAPDAAQEAAELAQVSLGSAWPAGWPGDPTLSLPCLKKKYLIQASLLLFRFFSPFFLLSFLRAFVPLLFSHGVLNHRFTTALYFVPISATLRPRLRP